jgi:hypothetical protein
MRKQLSVVLFTVLLLAGVILQGGCSDTQSKYSTAAFRYDQAAFPKAKPWTSEEFKDDPDNFQFAIIGDRTGGANVQGTFKIAMDQLNLLQPEFVINVGDIIEGYTEDKGELNKMWEEAEGLTGMLQMPFFYTRGNHDVSNPMAKEVWLERFGPNYYHFVYKDVLFMVLSNSVS